LFVHRIHCGPGALLAGWRQSTHSLNPTGLRVPAGEVAAVNFFWPATAHLTGGFLIEHSAPAITALVVAALVMLVARLLVATPDKSRSFRGRKHRSVRIDTPGRLRARWGDPSRSTAPLDRKSSARNRARRRSANPIANADFALIVEPGPASVIRMKPQHKTSLRLEGGSKPLRSSHLSADLAIGDRGGAEIYAR